MRRTLSLMAVLLVAATAAAASDSDDSRKTLKGLKGVNVLVEHLDSQAEAGGLYQTTIQTDVELKLRQAGIRVLTNAESLKTPGSSFFYVHVSSMRLRTRESYVYTIHVAFNQTVLLGRDLTIGTVGETWSCGGWLGIVPTTEFTSVVRASVKDAVDEFINDYLSVNPK